MPHDVFVCHASEDRRRAEEIVAALERERFTCWVAPRDVTPGTLWSGAILTAIKQSRVLLLLLSKAANESVYVLQEVDTARAKRVPVLPVRIEDVPPAEALEFYVGTTHWVDAFSAPSRRSEALVVAALERLLGPRVSTNASAPEASAYP